MEAGNPLRVRRARQARASGTECVPTTRGLPAPRIRATAASLRRPQVLTGIGLRAVRQGERAHSPSPAKRPAWWVVLATRGTADLPARARSQEGLAVGWDASAHREHSCFGL